MSSQEVHQAQLILNYIMSPGNNSLIYPFLEEVDPIALDLPDYRDIVHEPMWLGKMAEKFREQAYTSIKEFVCDFRLMLLNCYRYNGTSSRLGRLAEKLEMLFEQKLMLLPVEMRNKTTLQAVLSGGSAEDELFESGVSRRRLQNKLFSSNDNRQATPIRALMEEIEQARVGGITSSIFQLGTDDDDPLNADRRVHLIVSRLASWERKRYDEKLIESWPEFVIHEKAHDKFRILKKSPEFLESFQFLFLADRFLCISDSITASLLSVDSLANPAHRRRFHLREFEYSLMFDVRHTSVLAAIFNSLLASGKDRSLLTQASNTLKTYSSEAQHEFEAGLTEYSGPRASRGFDQLKEAIKTLKPPTYEIWQAELREKLHSWYETLHAKPNRTALWLFRRIGVPERFFHVFGQFSSPLEHCQFHELTLFKQIIIIRALVEHTQRTQDNLRVSMDRHIDWTSVRPVTLGEDYLSQEVKKHVVSYVHFPGVMGEGNDLRVYRMILAPDFREENVDWSPEEFVAQNFNSRIIEARNRPHREMLTGFPVPGPVYRLPSWIPESLARYTQQRWLQLLSAQQLRLNLETDTKRRNKLWNAIKTYKLLPMASMTDLYQAEGKNTQGKFSTKSARSLHEKLVKAAFDFAEDLFQKEPQMTQTLYYRIKSMKGPFPPEFLSSMMALLVNNYRRLILKAKSSSKRGGFRSLKNQTKEIEVEDSSIMDEMEEEEDDESRSYSENDSDPGSSPTPQPSELEEDDLAPAPEPKVEEPSPEEPKPEVKAENGLHPLPPEDVFNDPLESYSEDPYFELVAHDLPTLDVLIEQVRFQLDPRTPLKQEPPLDDNEETPPAICTSTSPLKIRISLKPEPKDEGEDEKAELEEEEEESEPEWEKPVSRKRGKGAKKRRSKRTKLAPKEEPYVEPQEIPVNPTAKLQELLSALQALRTSEEGSEGTRVDAAKLTRLRFRKDFEASLSNERQLQKARESPVKELAIEEGADDHSEVFSSGTASNFSDEDYCEERTKRRDKRPKKPLPRLPMVTPRPVLIAHRPPIMLPYPRTCVLAPKMALPRTSVVLTPIRPGTNLLRFAPFIRATRPLATVTPVPRLATQVLAAPRPMLFRIGDSLFTEDVKPVQIGPNGTVINLSEEAITPELRKKAQDMIANYRQISAGNRPTPIVQTTPSTSTQN
ncbi:hypothetical protein Ciccas_010267 [Cichlidogyrus casuarinus]|uniref:Bromo domain-containing protein n=1 Tax=Cichlidogyrus casuarinus TaxID=1844966 RepID=A0ABD2PVD9_9PLAT